MLPNNQPTRTAGKNSTQKRLWRHTFFFLLLSPLALLFLLSATGTARVSTGPLVLLSEPLDFTPKEFYIAQVVDERKEKSAVAWLLPEAKAPGQQAGAAQPVDLQGGGLVAIRKFMFESLARNTRLRPITIRLKECRITETAGAGGRVDGRIAIVMAFEYKRDGEVIHLLDYNGGARYARSASQQAMVEPTLRKALGESLRYLHTWINKEAPTNLKLATALQLHFTDFTLNNNPDTVFYNTSRPLTWNDFRGKPRGDSKFAATIFPSFAYEGHKEIKNGVLHLYLDLKVFMVPDNSWVKQDRSAYGLNHEQRHFDVVKLVVERYKQKLKSGIVTLEDYNSIIQYQFLEAFREMNQLQEQYEGETRHGLDTTAQERWNKKIDVELKQFGVK